MKVLLVGNYEFDGTISMKIFADMLLRGLTEAGIDVELIVPDPLVGRLKPAATGFGKWLGYLDKFLFFPFKLRALASKSDIIQICDQGNAMYSFAAGKTPVIVNCHDLVAVRGALGEVPECPASPFGKILQKWVVRGLRRAQLIICPSEYSFNDARRLLPQASRVCILPNALAYPFTVLPSDEVDRRLQDVPGINRPFIMNIGSNLARKNRDGLLRIFSRAVEQVDLQLVVAGAPLDSELTQLAESLNIQDRVVNVKRPSVEVVEALYNSAVALVFPSRYEGFGWPPVEAQACGCPVVGSNIPTTVEMVGESAHLFPLDDEAGMTAAIVRLSTDTAERDRLRRLGLANVRERFQLDSMVRAYKTIYEGLLCPS